MMPGASRFSCRIALPVLIAFLLPACATRSGMEEERESVLDGISHVEDEFFFEVPHVSRWCDRLDGLVKHRIDAGDCELYVEEEGRGTPIVLINGGPGGTHHYFHPWFSRAARFARVIYYDQRGCGLSDWEPGEEGYSVEQAVQDLDAIRRALGIEKWVVLGYSYGGFLAQYYTINHPETVAGLVLLGASPGMWVEMQQGRQYNYISDEERTRLREIRNRISELAEEREWNYQEYINVLLYNNFLNGDWKRQHFYRPSLERASEIALFEWHHDQNFRSQLSSSQYAVDMTGAFDGCPVPTLILEGEWDLTWNTDKRDIIHGNHPGSEMVVFENAGHGIYDEQPDEFFKVLRRFIRRLPRIDRSEVVAWKDYLAEWNRERLSSPMFIVRSANWGRKGNEQIVAAYTRDWLEQPDIMDNLLKIGFAHYDVEDYEEALFIFSRMEVIKREEGEREYETMAMIWQGHMLDLLGRRSEAVSFYRRAAEMDITDTWSHDQFGMNYSLSPWAAERLRTPFKRVENIQP